ncbi:MAG: hypothetical protein RI885_646, partial [Actinomycetota bacterium]
MSERQSSSTAIIGELRGGARGDRASDPATPAPREPASTVVVEDVAKSPSWLALKAAAVELQPLQAKDGSIPDAATHRLAGELVTIIRTSIAALAPRFPHDADYLTALDADFARWVGGGFGVPDFLDALTAFQPQRARVDGIRHLVVFPMVTQNGSASKLVEAVLIEVIWPDFVADLEAGAYSNALFVPIRFLDFTPGYDTDSAVLFP